MQGGLTFVHGRGAVSCRSFNFSVPSGGVFVTGFGNLEEVRKEFLEILRSGDLGPSRLATVRLGEVDGVISGGLGTPVVGVSSLNSQVEGYSCMGCPRAAEVSPERVGES
jgi:hypothetical protein